MPAPALMRIAMPAITAKAANRLPLTPNFGNWIRARNLSPRLLDRNAIAAAPAPPPEDEMRSGVSISPVNKIGTV
jgi:hypothetical protein